MRPELLAMILGALIAALAMTAVMSGARMLGLSRLSLPLLLGTMATPNRDHAIPIGIAMHVAMGMLFALPYFGIFALLEEVTWWLGALLGAGHAAITHLVLFPALPGLHPRMASERDGPAPTPTLEPPGPLGLNYGKGTPLVSLLAHVIFGALLGAVGQLAE